jgi:hypothetical protein|tara:strand:+ start:364 stop:600 length:237 start_codon:yes stop_codon:yes gene_type:complete
MTYNQLQSILPNHEIHYIDDSTEFLNENNIEINKFKNNEFILFEYTIDYFPETIELLNKNNIKHSIHHDELDLKYIII